MLDTEIQKTKTSNKNLVRGILTKHCERCESESFHIGDRCLSCSPLETGIRIKYCCLCDKETRHNGSICIICKPESHSFNREEFYNSKIKGLILGGLRKIVSINEIDAFIGIPGVWSKETVEGKVLDVSQTKDIGREMLFSIRAIDLARINKDLSYETINRLSHTKRKYIDIVNTCDTIVFKVIARDIKSKGERELIEIKYAHKNRAEYWNPAPGQIKIIYET